MTESAATERARSPGGMTEHAAAEPESPNRPWSLRRRVTALCLLMAAVIAFLAAGAATTAIANRRQLNELLDQVGPMRTASSDLLASLVSQEAALRGYVVTASGKDLSTYHSARATETDLITRILSNPAATATVKAGIAKVAQAADDWRANVADPAIADIERGDLTSARNVINDVARDRFDTLRRAIEAVQKTMQGIRDDLSSSVRDSSSTLLFVLFAVAILGIGGAIGLLVALQRVVIEPVTDLARQVRTIADGEYGRAIRAGGPPELANLGLDVDQMRRQIASDLAEVEAGRRQIEESAALLEAQAAELTRSNRDLEQFAYVASHDLQEPLRKVSSFCQLLQRRYQGQLDERADQYIAFAVSGAQRMQRLINDLLAFSRIGRVTTGFTDVDLASVVTEASTARPDPRLLGEGEGAADDTIPPEITWTDLPVVHGDETLLTNLFTNLIGNSLKFRRPDLPARVAISARRLRGYWEISCVDNGIGIEPAYAEKVFVIFQRLHTRDAYAGTGIGLAVAKKIVEYHGGRIWVDTSVGDGTTIRFTLPVISEPTGAVIPGPAIRTKEPVR
jgi:signal transduction histidine kinase